MNDKAIKFDEFLKERDITWFHKEERDDEFKTVIYESALEAGEKRFPLFVVLDASLFAMVRVAVASNVSAGERRVELLEFMNEANSRFKVFKYYANAEDDVLYLDMSLPSLPEFFDPEAVLYLIAEILLPHVEEYAPKLEKIFADDTAKDA